MAIYTTKHHIKFADGIHEVGEAIELNSEAAQAVLGISDADVAQLLSIGAIELPVINEPVLFEALTDLTNTEQAATDPVVTDPVVTDPVVTDSVDSDPSTKTTKATK